VSYQFELRSTRQPGSAVPHIARAPSHVFRAGQKPWLVFVGPIASSARARTRASPPPRNRDASIRIVCAGNPIPVGIEQLPAFEDNQFADFNTWGGNLCLADVCSDSGW
jgi:hypothetical protein